jgi:3D (Asp-Asp-Asp) domain-containing protein
MKEFMFILLLLIIYTLIGTMEADPKDGIEYYYTFPECVYEETRGDEFIMTVTAYTSSVDECDDTPFITASQDSCRLGVVAADTMFKFGTKLLINGYNDGRPCIVLDRGSKIKGYSLDVWMKTKKEARVWGRRKIKVKRI